MKTRVLSTFLIATAVLSFAYAKRPLIFPQVLPEDEPVLDANVAAWKAAPARKTHKMLVIFFVKSGTYVGQGARVLHDVRARQEGVPRSHAAAPHSRRGAIRLGRQVGPTHQKRFPLLTERESFLCVGNVQQPTASNHQPTPHGRGAADAAPDSFRSPRHRAAASSRGDVAGKRRKIETHGAGAPCGTEESGARDSLPLPGRHKAKGAPRQFGVG